MFSQACVKNFVQGAVSASGPGGCVCLWVQKIIPKKLTLSFLISIVTIGKYQNKEILVRIVQKGVNMPRF